MSQQPGTPGWPGEPPPAGSTPPVPGGWQQGAAPQQPWSPQAKQPWSPQAQQPWQPAGVPPNPRPWQQSQPGQLPYGQQPQPGGPAGGPDRDPRQSFGEPPPAAVHIESFAPPKNSTATMVTIGLIVVLVLVVVGGLFFRGGPPTPSPTPSPKATVAPTSTQPGQPFETPDGQANGRWEILGSKWTGEGLSVNVRITADNGPLTYAFLAFSNQGADVVDAEAGPDQPALLRGTLRDDQTVQGWVYFVTPKADTTVILTTMGGKQMSALVVKG